MLERTSLPLVTRLLRALPDQELDALLARVSRSFYLSLAILPAQVREPISLAYLLARAADTIADTEAVARERRTELLSELRRAVALVDDGHLGEARAVAARLEEAVIGPTTIPEEQRLLGQLGLCLSRLRRLDRTDRTPIGTVLAALVRGMERDLARFDGKNLHALASTDELDEHCYLAAGCVGEFWTHVTAAHLDEVRHLASPQLLEGGVRLGKALQLVNVLRDVPSDLVQGRCYLPAPALEALGLAPHDLLLAGTRRRARPLIHQLAGLALDHVRAAFAYVTAIPASAPRLRLACLWPLWIGLATLEGLVTLDDPLDPAQPRKIERTQLYKVLGESVAVVAIDRLLQQRQRARVEAVAKRL